MTARIIEVTSEREIQEAIRGVSPARTSIRCIATTNSPDAEFLRAQATKASVPTSKDLLLLDLRAYDACVELDVEQRTVTVQAGMKFLKLHELIHARGFAVRGAINGSSELTVGGAVCTGSQVGSRRFTLYDDILTLTLVLASGEVRTFSKSEPAFDGVYCSLGLMGVLSTVTFQLVPTFDCRGVRQFITEEEMFEACSPERLTAAEYVSLEWYPKSGLGKPALLRQVEVVETKHEPARSRVGALVQQRTKRPVNITATDAFVAKMLLTLATWSKVLTKPLARLYVQLIRLEFVTTYLGYSVLEMLGRALLPSAEPDLEALKAQLKRLRGTPDACTFHGPWHQLIPNDINLTLQLIEIHYTEIIIPIHQTRAFMAGLAELFRAEPERVPLTAIAVDPIPACPGHLAKNAGSPGELHCYVTIILSPQEVSVQGGDVQASFRPYWDLATKMFGASGWRLHWGKLMDARMGAAELEVMFGAEPWRKWTALRQELDPEGLFLSREGGPNSLQLSRVL